MSTSQAIVCIVSYQDKNTHHHKTISFGNGL